MASASVIWLGTAVGMCAKAARACAATVRCSASSGTSSGAWQRETSAPGTSRASSATASAMVWMWPYML